MTVHSFEEARMKKIPHTAGEAMCHACYHKWIAVAALERESQWLKCPKCGLNRGYYEAPPVRPDKLVRACECGGQLFYITPDGPYCALCARWLDLH